MTYVIKCDDCKTEIGKTNNMMESVQGGQCLRCNPNQPHKGGPMPHTPGRWTYEYIEDDESRCGYLVRKLNKSFPAPLDIML